MTQTISFEWKGVAKVNLIGNFFIITIGIDICKHDINWHSNDECFLNFSECFFMH